MTAERYYVLGITGEAGTSYSVLDRYTCHIEVATFYQVKGPNTRHAADAECRRLNALDLEAVA